MKEEEHVQEDDELTLVAWIPSAWSERLEIDDGVAEELRPSVKKTRMAARHQTVPGRFP